ncbi:Protein disulfide-isomerase TMX3 [Nibea albiflora]|uniref:Protein disulfide-isomerase TMX3 n=1 Tax=Nibea albiflora TaxID=240163 RepID=A0ACB7F537_NIBAL|nr:Protein disulfide-isomerase TMX3 [Nibea albiflora]
MEIGEVGAQDESSSNLFQEYEDASLSSWVNKERFQGYLQIDGFTLYELGETGKLVAIAVIDEKDPTEESGRLKTLIQRVAKEYREHFNSEVTVPSVIILNTSNEQYFLPSEPIETMEQLVQFINGVLNGSAQAYGGDGFIQRIKRVAFDARSTIMSVFRSSPLLGCFLFGLPLGVISLMCYGICTAESDDGSDDIDALKREGLTDEEDEEEEETQRAAELEGPDEGENAEDDAGEKDPEEKKTD